MERITQNQDDHLLHYLDGALNEKEKREVETLLLNNGNLKNRLEELRHIHSHLNTKTRLEQPSKLFTELVMNNLDRVPARSGLSPRNGLFLFFGVIVAVGIMSLLLSLGVFDDMKNTISLDKLPIENKYIKNPLPSVSFNGKWMINGILVFAMGLAFVLLDRTILKPYFEKRSRMQF